MKIKYGIQMAEALVSLRTWLKKAKLEDAEVLIINGEITVFLDGYGGFGTVGNVPEGDARKTLADELNRLQDHTQEAIASSRPVWQDHGKRW
mgnify:CR=1 FL=1